MFGKTLERTRAFSAEDKIEQISALLERLGVTKKEKEAVIEGQEKGKQKEREPQQPAEEGEKEEGEGNKEKTKATFVFI